MDACSTCCAPLQKTFCNPKWFTLDTRQAEIFTIAARTEDEIWHSVNTGIWRMKDRDRCELCRYLNCRIPVYLAFFCDNYFQGVARLLSFPSCCGDCYVQWYYIKCMHMMEFFCITGCYTYMHMLQLAQNQVLRFLLHFHRYCCPCQCCPCEPSNCCGNNRKMIGPSEVDCKSLDGSAGLNEGHVYILKVSTDQIAAIRNDSCFTYIPNGSLQDPVQHLASNPVYICLEDICSERYEGLMQAQGVKPPGEGQQCRAVQLCMRWAADGPVDTADCFQMVSVAENLNKIFFPMDAEKLLGKFKVVRDQLMTAPPDESEEKEKCEKEGEKDCENTADKPGEHSVPAQQTREGCEQSLKNGEKKKDPLNCASPEVNHCGDSGHVTRNSS